MAGSVSTASAQVAGAGRLAAILYGLFAYAVGCAAILYLIGFVGNWLVPKSIDSGPAVPFGQAVTVDAFLLLLFALQHSAMARPGFKKWWTTVIPQPLERSTYILFVGLVLGLLFWQWQPLPQTIWKVEYPVGSFALSGLFWMGWAVVLLAILTIGHLHFFGMRQVYFHFQNREYPLYNFKSSVLYKHVRHPIMLGFIIAFWSTPQMTAGHLFFSAFMTGYILFAVKIEERDLVRFYGEAYRKYQREVPMLIPLKRKK